MRRRWARGNSGCYGPRKIVRLTGATEGNVYQTLERSLERAGPPPSGSSVQRQRRVAPGCLGSLAISRSRQPDKLPTDRRRNASERGAWTSPATAPTAGRPSRRATADRVSRNENQLVFAWKDGGRGSPEVFPAALDTITGIRELSGGRIVVGSMRPSLGLFDRTGSVLSQLDVPGTDFRDQRTLKVSPDGKQVLFHFDSDDDKSLAAFDISKRALDLSPARRPELIAP